MFGKLCHSFSENPKKMAVFKKIFFSYARPAFINPKSFNLLIFEALDEPDSQIIHTMVWINKVGRCGGLWR